MKVLILGGDGMLGSQAYKTLSKNFDVKVTLRNPIEFYSSLDLFDDNNSYFGIDAFNFDSIQSVFSRFQPQVLINAIGIVKQREESSDYISSITINSLLPHKLYELCFNNSCKFFHISTDCVFDGIDGNYHDDSFPNAKDLYGRSKLLGEVNSIGAYTLRTSIIGNELSRHKSLLDWFISQNNKLVKGFKNAVFSGFTTIELSHIIENLICNYSDEYGLYQVSSNPISKYDLLCLIKERYNLDIEIEPDFDFYCNRSLDSSIFKNKFNYNPPSWVEMIKDLPDL